MTASISIESSKDSETESSKTESVVFLASLDFLLQILSGVSSESLKFSD